MNLKPFALSLTSALVGGCLVLSLQASAQHAGHDMGGSKSMAKTEQGASLLHAEMMKPMDMSKPMPVDTDRAFAQMMAAHHASGIRMARIEIKYGNDPKAKAMAQKIVKAQTAEKTQLEKLAKTAR